MAGGARSEAPEVAMVVGRPEIRGTFGAAAATNSLAAATAMATLERGGNAFDAAAAAGFVLQVVEPHYNGLGGDASVIGYSAGYDRVDVVCGQGPVPAAATVEHFRHLGLRHIPGSGLLPACVPGAFSAWMQLLAEHGSLPLADILQPAIDYAAAGFPLLSETAHTIRTMEPLFATEWVESGRVYLPGGQPPDVGRRFRNPVLAATYQRLVAEAQAAGGDRQGQMMAAERCFHEGFVAEAIDDFVAASEVLDSTGQPHRGLLNGADLAGWRATIEPPATLDYRGLRVCKPGPWSQGPVFLQQLALLEGFDLAATGAMPDTADYVHLVAESAKLAFADREAWYGDPAFGDVPLADLLSPSYTDDRRRLISQRASADLIPGSPGGRQPHLPRREPAGDPATATHWLEQLGNGLPTVAPAVLQASSARGDTCTVAVTDRHGNMVAAVPSGGWLKSSPVIPGLGFSLGTRAQTMNLEEGHPNSLGPRRRPRTTLSPTLVLRGGQPIMAFGTPGGDRQDQWTLEFFLAVTHFGLGLQEAMLMPAFHTDQVPSSFVPHEARPGTVTVEANCPLATVTTLRSKGHDVTLAPQYSLGKVCAVGVVPEDGLVRAAASPRGAQAYAVGR